MKSAPLQKRGELPPTYLKACQLSDIPSFKFLCTLFKVVWAQNQPFTTKTNENTKFAPLREGGPPPSPLRHVNCIVYLLPSSYTHYSESIEPKISLLWQKLTKIRALPHAEKGGRPPPPLMECHLGPTPRVDPNGPRNHPRTRAKL